MSKHASDAILEGRRIGLGYRHFVTRPRPIPRSSNMAADACFVVTTTSPACMQASDVLISCPPKALLVFFQFHESSNADLHPLQSSLNYLLFFSFRSSKRNYQPINSFFH